MWTKAEPGELKTKAGGWRLETKVMSNVEPKELRALV